MSKISKIKKVAIFLPIYNIAGGERVVFRLANGLAKNGINVDLVLFKKGERKLDFNFCSNVNVIKITGKKTISFLIKAIKYLKDFRPDCILAQDNWAGLVALLSKKISRISIPIVITIHATLGERWREYKNKFKKWFDKVIVKKILSSVDAVVTISRGSRDDLISMFDINPERIHLIYNAVIDEKILEMAKENINLEAYFPYILGVGRLTKQKGFDILIKAFSLVKKNYNGNIHLLILGDGPERGHLEKLARELGIKNYVHMPGYIENPYPYITNASVFVLSSRWEGLSTVLIEALAIGTPIVSTDCLSSPREILKDGKLGRLVPVEDPTALALAILETINNPIIIQNDISWKRFTVQHAAENYIHLIEHLIYIKKLKNILQKRPCWKICAE
ncbi:MAG: glycosyltransferase [Candidatus Micrarchaeia archaeon]